MAASCAQPNIAALLSRRETLKYMVAAGEECTLVPALAVSERDAVVYSRQPLTSYSRKIGLAWRRSDPREQEFSVLAGRLKKIAGSFDVDMQAV